MSESPSWMMPRRPAFCAKNEEALEKAYSFVNDVMGGSGEQVLGVESAA